MESLAGEVEPFGIRTMIVEPGFFRTELLTPESTKFGELSIDDYGERKSRERCDLASMNGKQAGDPAKLAQALFSSPARAGAAALGRRRRRRGRDQAEGRIPDCRRPREPRPFQPPRPRRQLRTPT